MKTLKWYLLLVLFSLLSTLTGRLLLAQENEPVAPGTPPGLAAPGYVILSNGDTLQGKIRWTLKYIENNIAEIKFIAVNGTTKNFSAVNIRGFGFRRQIFMDNDPHRVTLDMENYLSMPSMKKGDKVFLCRLLNGRITVFMNRNAIGITSSQVVTDSKIDGIAFSFSASDGLSVGPSYHTEYAYIKGRSRYSSYLVSKENGALIKVEKENYETFLKTLFGDCQAINDEIAKNPDLAKFKNFMILTEVYNKLCGNF